MNQGTVAGKYAARSLGRHPRRSFLTVLGVGVGCALCMFVIAFVRGEGEMLMRAAANSGVGHLRVVPERWLGSRENDARLPADWPQLRERLAARDNVRLVTPHARTDGLLAFGTRVVGVEMLGVDPAVEPQLNRLVRTVGQGRYLEAADRNATVIGAAIAERLDVALDDRLMVTVAGQDGEMHAAMLRIVGIVDTGSRDLNASICHVPLAQLGELSGQPGAAELTLLLKDPDRLEATRQAIAGALPDGLAVLDWAALKPELASGAQLDQVWGKLVSGIVMLVVLLGIASAQLAAALERRREFAVLAALGMSRRRLVGVMLLEGVVLGLLGALAGLLLGLPSTGLAARYGIDFTDLMPDSEMAVSNILMDPVIYPDFGWWLLPLAFFLALAATLLSSLYPAWYAVSTDPADALRVEQ